MHKIIIQILFATSLLNLTACHQAKSKHWQGYVEGEYIYLSSPLSGALQKLPHTKGHAIKKGALVFTLDAKPQIYSTQTAEAHLKATTYELNNLKTGQRKVRLAAIEAQLQQQQVRLKLYKTQLRRVKKLFANNAIDKSQLDQARANFQQQSATVNQYKKNLAAARLGSRNDIIAAKEQSIQAGKTGVEQAKWAVAQKSVHAPHAGHIFDTYYRVGEQVPAGAPVASILSKENIRIIFFVNQNELTQLKLNRALQIQCNGCKKPLQANISYISSQAEYTPPMIYSNNNDNKFVYRIEARAKHPSQQAWHPGQPVTITR